MFLSSPSTGVRKSYTTAHISKSCLSLPDRNAYLEEAGHGLISTADLELVEGSFVAVATTSRALGGSLIGVVPRAGAAEDVFPLLGLECAPREQGRLDGALVGTGTAFETIAAVFGGW